MECSSRWHWSFHNHLFQFIQGTLYSVTISNHSVNHMTLKILPHLSLSAQVAIKPVIWQETLIVATNHSLIFIAIFISILCSRPAVIVISCRGVLVCIVPLKKKKKLLKDLPCKLPDAIQPYTASTVQKLWETFHEIYSIITNKTLLEDDMDSYFEKAKNWVNLFTSLCDKKIGQM